METTLSQQKFAATSGYRAYQGGYFSVLVSPDDTDGAVAMIDFSMPKGAEPPLHMHMQEDELFYVQEGEVSFFVGGEQINISAGGAAFAPRCIPHRFVINSPSARMIITLTPGDFANYFMEFSSVADAPPLLTPPQGPPPAELIETMTKRLKDRFNVLFL